MAILDITQGLQSVATNMPDNTSREITEAVMREQNGNLWDSSINRIDDKLLLNLRDYQDRAYEVGECCTYDDGNGAKIYQATSAVTGGPFNPANWQVIGGAGVESFNGRTGIVSPIANDYNAEQIANMATNTSALFQLCHEWTYCGPRDSSWRCWRLYGRKSCCI